MSRKIIINKNIIFEPEKKIISGKKGEIKLSASATLCFEILIENAGVLVTHNQLYDFAWRRFGMEPTSTSLYQNISMLRKSLKKIGMHENIIRTMPRRGFLVSPVTEIDDGKKEKNKVMDICRKNEINEHQSSAAQTSEKVSAPAEEKTNEKENENELEKNNKETVSLENNKEKYDKKKVKLKKNLFNIKIILSCALGLALGFIPHLKERYIDKRLQFTREPVFYRGCSVFTNNTKNFHPAELEEILNYIEINCSNKKNLYITNYDYSNKISVILCQNPLTSSSVLNCNSYYYILDKKE